MQRHRLVAAAAFLGRAVVAWVVFAVVAIAAMSLNRVSYETLGYADAVDVVTPVDMLWRWVWSLLGFYDLTVTAKWDYWGSCEILPLVGSRLLPVHRACVAATLLLPGAILAFRTYRRAAERYVQTRCEHCRRPLSGLWSNACPECGRNL